MVEQDDEERGERKAELLEKLKNEQAPDKGDEGIEWEEGVVEASTDGPPAWAKVPVDLSMPPGWVVFFVRFRAAWTNTPGKGDRSVILWNLSEADEKLAARAARGDALRLVDEMSKRMIRAIDGERADWTGKPGPSNVGAFWSEIGGKCRYQLKSLYLKNHTLSPEENLDFFEHCVASRSAG